MSNKRWLCVVLTALLVAAAVPAASAADLLSVGGADNVQADEWYTLTLTYVGDDPVDLHYDYRSIVLSGPPHHLDSPGTYLFEASVQPSSAGSPYLNVTAETADGQTYLARWNFSLYYGANATQQPTDEDASASPAVSPEPSDVPDDPDASVSEVPAAASQPAPAASRAPVQTSTARPGSTKDDVPKTADASPDLWMLACMTAAAVLAGGMSLRRLGCRQQ